MYLVFGLTGVATSGSSGFKYAIFGVKKGDIYFFAALKGFQAESFLFGLHAMHSSFLNRVRYSSPEPLQVLSVAVNFAALVRFGCLIHVGVRHLTAIVVVLRENLQELFFFFE